MSEKLQAVIAYLIDVKKVDGMTPKKLQKMLYYIYSWHLVFTAEDETDDELSNAKLFPETFEAWVHGPVIRKVYNKYKNNRNNEILSSMYNIDVDKVLNPDEIETIEQVINAYGEYNGNQLEYMTHDEKPWIEARGDRRSYDYCDVELSDKTIFRYYSARLN